MANTITISVSSADLAYIEENSSISPSKLFRSAVQLHRHREEFIQIYDIWDFCLVLREQQEKFIFLQKEIQRRNERIESMQDVLAQKEINERRIRVAKQETDGITPTFPTAQSG